MTSRNQRPLGAVRSIRAAASMLVLVVALVAGCGDRTRTPTEPSLDLTGSWALSVEGVCQGPLTITQTGTTFSVTGTVGGAMCPFGASGFGDGLLNGREISFGIGFGSGADPSGSGLGSVTFQGTVEPNGNRMSGSYQGNRSGTWAAVRN